jgi:7,8-dihydropterin-6-yl-methyl-4-(beta-D-ribofuranosyl)aminobenzene 5'-phosphate synthase
MTCLRTFVTACGVALLAGGFCTQVQPQAQAPPQAQLSSSTASAPAEVHSLKITILSTMLANEGLGEWGFSALVEADGKKILFDTGERPNTVLENAKELQLDLSDAQIVILSHFHHDHTTGLMTLRREYSKKNPRALSVTHVGKGIFWERRGELQNIAHFGKGVSLEQLGFLQNHMIAVKKEYEATGGVFVEHDKPEEILPGVWLTGPVPRVFPERNYPGKIEVATDKGWAEDTVPEDLSLVFNTSKGLVLLTGCGHAGIINTLQYARKFIRPAPVDAAIGGFHLFSAKDEQLDWTADKLKEFQTAQVLGAHCTGVQSVYHLRQRMGLTRRTCSVGSVGATYDLKDGIQTGLISR